MKRSLLAVVILLIALAAVAQVPAMPSFSADMAMKTSARDRGMTGKMYMGAGKMRMDMTNEGGKVSMITDPTRKTSYMVMHNERMYMELGAGGPMNPMQRGPRMPDVKPVAGDTPCAGRAGATCTKAGSEMMNGRMCDRWEIASSNKSEAGTVWIDQKTRMPIKTAMQDGSSWELTNFKEGPQDASLFAPPAGYEKFDMGAMMRQR